MIRRPCIITASVLVLAVAIDLLNGFPHWTIGIPLYVLLAVISFANPPMSLAWTAVGLGIVWVLYRVCRC